MFLVCQVQLTDGHGAGIPMRQRVESDLSSLQPLPTITSTQSLNGGAAEALDVRAMKGQVTSEEEDTKKCYFVKQRRLM